MIWASWASRQITVLGVLFCFLFFVGEGRQALAKSWGHFPPHSKSKNNTPGIKCLIFQGFFSLNRVATKQTTRNSTFCQQGPSKWGQDFQALSTIPLSRPLRLLWKLSSFQIMLSGDTLQCLRVLCGANSKYCTTFKLKWPTKYSSSHKSYHVTVQNPPMASHITLRKS